jgi:tetratricopeptide (TPR) repeat protein
MVTRLALATLCVLSVAAGPAHAADWISLRTPHFLLIGDASASEIRNVALRFEQFREAVTTVFPVFADKTPGPPVVVFVFRNEKSYQPFLPQFNGKPVKVAGYFLNGRDVNYITMTANSRGEEFQTVYHEFTHLLVNRVMPDLPQWFDEGLAEYFSTFELQGNKAQFGVPVLRHVALLRQRQMPLAELFAVSHDSATYNEGNRRSMFYAGSWALLHYSILAKTERLAQLERFSQFLNDGDPVATAFEKAFGYSTAALDTELLRYVRQSSMNFHIASIEQKISRRVEAEVSPLTEPEAQAWLGDLLAHAGRLDEAAARLKQAVEGAPDLALAHASLGALLTRQGKNDMAMPHLQRAASLKSPNEFVHYSYGAALVERARSNPSASDDLLQGIAALARAVELRPGFTDAQRMLGYAHLLNGNSEMAYAVLRRALDENQGDHDTALLMSQIDLRLGRVSEARRLLGPVVARATEPALRDQARNLLAQSTQIQMQQKLRAEAGLTGQRLESKPGGSIPVFRKTLPGEVRGYGVFTRVDCTPTGIVIEVRVPGATIRAHTATFADVDFLSYQQKQSASISCGPRTPPEEVYLTWRPGDVGGGDKQTAVAVELLPDGFVPQP